MKKLGFALIALAASLAASPLLAQTPSTTAPSTSKPMTAPATPGKPAASVATPATKAVLIDINSATKEELDALPGIGSARADAIIKGRPYRGKDDLLNKKVIPSNAYNGIKDRIIAKQS